jgi:hypothetical protein
MEGMIPDKRHVVRLVEKAYEGTLCLPNFQRDFVWRREEVADLVRSILRGYFIGSLLLLRCDPQSPPFAPAFLRGAKPPLREPRPELLVLDGQQRLSALLYALTAPDLGLRDSTQRRWFFLDLQLLRQDPDDGGIVFDRSEKELDGLDRPNVQFQRQILPCTQLLKSGDFMKWRDGLDDWLLSNEPEKQRLFRADWRESWNTAINDFQNFDVSLVELPRIEDSDSEAIGRVCAIFEKLNSTGVELSIYDLLTARLYRSGIRLHDLWNQACRSHERLMHWSGGKPDTNKFGVLLLRTLALLRGLDPKPRILIEMEPDGFERDWQRAAEAMERALELVTFVGSDGFGVFDPKWLPGYGLLPPLAALRAEIDERKLGEGERSELRRWYWSNVFLERYSSAVESKSRKDYAEMLAHWVTGASEPTVFSEARARVGADGYSIRESASYASAVYSGMFCLLAIGGARDWRRIEDITLQDLQDHHIFPRDYLTKHGIERRSQVNSIVNRTLISDETNGKIQNKAPADYLSSKELFPQGANESLLSPHFLPEDTVDAMKKATAGLSDGDVAAVYDTFCRLREAAMIEEIRRVCGVA